MNIITSPVHASLPVCREESGLSGGIRQIIGVRPRIDVVRTLGADFHEVLACGKHTLRAVSAVCLDQRDITRFSAILAGHLEADFSAEVEIQIKIAFLIQCDLVEVTGFIIADPVGSRLSGGERHGVFLDVVAAGSGGVALVDREIVERVLIPLAFISGFNRDIVLLSGFQQNVLAEDVGCCVLRIGCALDCFALELFASGVVQRHFYFGFHFRYTEFDCSVECGCELVVVHFVSVSDPSAGEETVPVDVEENRLCGSRVIVRGCRLEEVVGNADRVICVLLAFSFVAGFHHDVHFA